MNKCEVSEIKRHFKIDDNLLVLHHILTAVVNPDSSDKQVRYQKVSSVYEIDEKELVLYYDILKKVMSTKLGINLVEYGFPKTAYEEGKAQNVLYDVMRSGFTNESNVQAFINKIVDNTSIGGTYAVISAHCTYTRFKKNASDEENKYSSAEYTFVVTAICDLSANEPLLHYDLYSDTMPDVAPMWFIEKKPTDGFLFPAYNDRDTDVNSVMYYMNKPDSPNLSIIRDVLDCNFELSPAGIMNGYKYIIESVKCGDMVCRVIESMNEKISNLIESHKSETEITTLSKSEFTALLEATLYEMFDAQSVHDMMNVAEQSYELMFKNCSLAASNLLFSKITIETDSAILTIKLGRSAHYSIDSTKAQLSFNDGAYTVNGITVTK